MDLFEIVNFPTVVENNHESVLRSYHILQKVKDYLQDGVPHKVILEIIEELEGENGSTSTI